MNILAIDQATKTGWCVSREIYGEWDLSIKKDESSGMRLVRFESKLREVIKLRDINLVVYERVAGRFKNAIITSAEIVGVMKKVLEELNIPYRAYSAKEIKGFATGNGNASKDMMIKAVKKKYGIEVKSDNIADAIHIWNLADSEYNQVTAKKSTSVETRKADIMKRLKNKKK